MMRVPVGADGTASLMAEKISVAPSQRTTQTQQMLQGRKMRKFLKIALPHIALYVLLFLYLMAGAWAFSKIENNAERLQMFKKLQQIETVYRQIASELAEECSIYKVPIDEQRKFHQQLYESLSRISKYMEGPQFRLDAYDEPDLDEILPPRWNVMSSVLYALSILTTTGYAPTSPMTPLGQWFSIGYGLIGIPLMILAAVDIGRFLSDVVLISYARLMRTFSLFVEVKKRNISQLESEALKQINRLQLQAKPRMTFSRKVKPQEGKQKYGREKPPKITKESGSEEAKTAEESKQRLPLSVNAAILLMFCMLGGLVYIAAGGNEKSFIEGFFVTFNLVANLTMSEMPDISHLLTVIYIFIFVTFGLAGRVEFSKKFAISLLLNKVLSMCAELAASELKWVFLKIHYFGRKINWKRKAEKKKEEDQMEFEVKELLKIIDQIRAKYPDKQDITSLDILKYVQELNGVYGMGNPYRTFNMYLAQLQHHRRDTIAFMPQSFDVLKFADEMDVEDPQDWIPQTIVSTGSSTVTALAQTWERYRRGEQNTFIPFVPFSV